MNLNAEDPLKIQVKLAEDPIKIQIHMPETPVIRVESGAGPQGPKGKQGEKGDDYILTEEDKDNIAELAADKVDLSDYVKKTEVPVESGSGIGSAKTKDFEYNGILYANAADGLGSFAEGVYNFAEGVCSHSEGALSVASGNYAHAEGYHFAGTLYLTGEENSTTYNYDASILIEEGCYITDQLKWHSKILSVDETNKSIVVSKTYGQACNNTRFAYIDGRATGSASHAEGNRTRADGASSHAEGFFTAASGKNSHSEGMQSQATGTASHSEGGYTKALKYYSHAEGYMAIASGNASHAEGNGTIAEAAISHTEGLKTIAKGVSSHVEGKYNVVDSYYAHIVGNGSGANARSNAYALDWEGNGKYAGDAYVHSNPDSSGGDKLATENYVDDAVSHISSMAIHICTAQEYDAQTGIPTIANPDATTFYLVPGGEGNNLFIEWTYVNNAWERFGSADVDLSNYVQKTDYASASNAGVVKISGAMGIDIINGFLTMATADHAYIQDGTHVRKAIPPKFQHESAFYGLAKAAGDTTQSQSSNQVGTYTDEAKAAIQQMLDVPSKSDIPEVPVGDVQVNGVSVVNEGIANVPCANANVLGVVQTEAEYGITIMAGTKGKLRVQQASATQVKAGQQAYKPIVPANQHTAVFYGLAAAAGDTTQSQSANAVGSYTDEAKAAVRTMLGLDNLSILAIVENGLPAAEGVEW